MKRNKIVFGIVALLLISQIEIVASSFFSKFKKDKKEIEQAPKANETLGVLPNTQVVPNPKFDTEQPYVYPAGIAVKSVVFIKAIQKAKIVTRKRERHPLDEFIEKFFNEKFSDTERFKSKPRVGAGSGVILTEDGYIITNNHVVNGADILEVTLNNGQKYTAKLIGADTTTDLAVIKIEAKSLPYLLFADSDKVKVGERVLAVGNPFGLKATVTNGIISAKGRSRSELNPNNPMEIGSYLQTNAIINVGNSGGALINLNGEVLGINTAMLGPFSGYGFAIPANVAKKVVTDIMKYGMVQKGILNVTAINVSLLKEAIELPKGENDALRKAFFKDSDLNEAKVKSIISKLTGPIAGVMIVKTQKNRAAYKAGLQPYDILIGVDDRKIDQMYELQEVLLKFYKPGDKITIHFIRNGKAKQTSLVLETDTKYRVVKVSPNQTQTSDIEGAIFEDVSDFIKKKHNLKGGVIVKQLAKGKWKSVGIKEGFIITNITCLDCNTKYIVIDNIKTLCNTLNNIQDTKIVIEGIYPTSSSKKEIHALYW